MGQLKQQTMIDATEERKNRFTGESVLLTPHEAKIHDDIFINELSATLEDKEAGIVCCFNCPILFLLYLLITYLSTMAINSPLSLLSHYAVFFTLTANGVM